MPTAIVLSVYTLIQRTGICIVHVGGSKKRWRSSQQSHE